MKMRLRDMRSLNSTAVKMAKYVNVLAPVLLLVAGFSVYAAISEVDKALNSGGHTAANAITKTVKPSLQRLPLDANGYREAGQVLSRLNPSVKVQYEKDKDHLMVAITDPVLLTEWVYLLSTMQSYRPGLLWRADRICLKKCDGGLAAVAELKAYTQQIAIN
jgi:hypothetical protein